MSRASKLRLYPRKPCATPGCPETTCRKFCYACKAAERGSRRCKTFGCERQIRPLSSRTICEVCYKQSSGTGQCSGYGTKVKLRKRCTMCEGQSWRRDVDGCHQCGLPYAPEVVKRSEVLTRPASIFTDRSVRY